MDAVVKNTLKRADALTGSRKNTLVAAGAVGAVALGSYLLWPRTSRHGHPQPTPLRMLQLALKAGTESALGWFQSSTKEERAARFVEANAKPGDAESVLTALDTFARQDAFLMSVGDDKAGLLRKRLAASPPTVAMEIGGYCGYSAVLIGSHLAEGGHLYSFEVNPVFAAIARRVIGHAGLSDRVTVIDGSVETSLASLRTEHGLALGSLDFIFIDHWKNLYVPDLQRVERSGLMRRGTLVAADNILFPGCPDMIDHMKAGRYANYTLEMSNVEYLPWLADAIAFAEYR